MLKERVSKLSLTDLGMIKLAMLLFGVWLVGLIISFGEVQVAFFVRWAWAFLALGIIFGIKPLVRFFWGKKVAEGEVPVKRKRKKK